MSMHSILKYFISSILLLCFSSTSSASSLIKLDPEKISIGKIISGDVVEEHFTLTNVGNSPVDIDEILSYCGCTVVNFRPQTLSPGKAITVQFRLDSKTLQGAITRRITINSSDPSSPTKDLMVEAYVLSLPHRSMSGESIFSGECKTCHAAVTGDQFGEPLFQKVCASCHGNYGLGGVAKTINDYDYVTAHAADYFRKIISYGIEGTTMPGFHQLAAGPLTDQQIQSLVELMVWWREGYILKRGELDHRR